MQFPPLPPDADNAPDSPVSFHFEDVEFELADPAFLRSWLLNIATAEGKPFHEVNYIFCSDEYLRRVNVEYLDHDFFTDVITFPYGEAGEIHGDVFVSSERVTENAEAHGVSFRHELCRVLAHGVLHLAGYGDKTEKEATQMRAKENFYLEQLYHA